MRKIRGVDRGQLYAMKVLKKATLKGEPGGIIPNDRLIKSFRELAGPRRAPSERLVCSFNASFV